MERVSLPVQKWQAIGMDCIVGLPRITRDGRVYDSVLTVTDQDDTLRPNMEGSFGPRHSRPIHPFDRKLPRVTPIHHLRQRRPIHVSLLGTVVLPTEHQTPTFKRFSPPDQRVNRENERHH